MNAQEIKAIKTVKDTEAYPEIILEQVDSLVRDILECEFPDHPEYIEEYSHLFVLVGNAEYDAIWGCNGIPYDYKDLDLLYPTTEENAQMTIDTFCKQNNITLQSDYVSHNPNMIDTGYRMNHYKVTLKREYKDNGKRTRRSFTTYYSMGLSLEGDPQVTDVLDCLAMDSSFTDQDFESWCDEFGYDTDSRKAYRTWQAIKRNDAKLRRFLGDSLYDTLINDVERL